MGASAAISVLGKLQEKKRREQQERARKVKSEIIELNDPLHLLSHSSIECCLDDG